MRLPRRISLAIAALGCVALAACTSSGGDPDGAGTSTVTETVTASASPPAGSGSASSTPPASVTPGAGCPAGGEGVPSGAASRTIFDIDGDGRPDTLWLNTAAAPTVIGFTTASGATAHASVSFAGGSQPNALAADLRGDGSQILAFVGNSRVVNLLTFRDCALSTVTNPQGQPYTFDLGFAGNGTGVGCVDATGDGQTDLVGLNVVRDAAGQPTSITRTVIDVRGTSASNGASSTVAITPDALASASSVSCGEATYADSGV